MCVWQGVIPCKGHRGLGSNSGIILRSCNPFETGSHWNLELTNQAKLAGWQAPTIHLSPPFSARITNTPHCGGGVVVRMT